MISINARYVGECYSFTVIFDADSVHSTGAAECLDFSAFYSDARDALSDLFLHAARECAAFRLADSIFDGRFYI